MDHSNQTFEDVTVELDGNSFDNCVFKNVLFQYSGGDLQMNRCRIESFQINFGGPLANGLYALHQLFGTEGLSQIIRGFTDPSPGEIVLKSDAEPTN